jgi:hypothetical protein
MSRSSVEILNDIVFYITSLNMPFSQWYVGIASNPSHRLFSEHNVEISTSWIYRDAGDLKTARKVKHELVERYNLISGADDDDQRNKYVYAYEITSSTKQ